MKENLRSNKHMQTTVTNSINHQGATARREKRAATKMPVRWAAGAAVGVISVLLSMSQSVSAQQISSKENFVAPTVFQAAGPTGASIQGTLDAYRAALGGLLNNNNPGPLNSG